MSTGLEAVYAGQYRRLVALVTAVTGSLADAEEAVQEAFARALAPAGRREVLADPEAWLYRVAVTLARSRWRRARHGRRLAIELAEAENRIPEPPDPTDARLALLDALRRLPFEQREAIVLHHLADLPVADVAVRVGAPVGTVKARLARGRDALAKLLTRDAEGGGRHV